MPEVETLQTNVEYHLNYNKFYQGRIDCSFCMKTMDEAALKQAKIARRSAKSAFTRAGKYSLTLLDEINSLLHVALHSVTVTNCSKDQFMNPLLPLYM